MRDFSTATYKTKPRFLLSATSGTPIAPLTVDEKAFARANIAEQERLMEIQRERISRLHDVLRPANDNQSSPMKAAA